LIAAACILAAAGIVYWRASARGLDRRVESPLAIVPPGAALVLSLEVRKLAATPAGAELLKKYAGSYLGGVGADCAARMIQRAESLLLVIDGAQDQLALPEPSELAIIAAGPLEDEAVAACVEQAIQKKKGKPVRTSIGSFVTIRDQRGMSGEVAVRPGGPLVISNGRYLRDILDAADGKQRPPSELERTRDALHAELRRSFGRNAPLVATVTLPSGWLERTLDDADAKLSPLSELRSAALRLEPAGDGFVLEALLGHGSTQAAERVEKLMLELLPELEPWLAEQLGRRATAQLVPRREQATLRLSLHLTRDEIDKLLQAAGR